MKRATFSILAATVWITFSEFVRNELLLKSFWVSHYQTLGLTFPSSPINGMVWTLWALLFAIAIFSLVKQFKLWQATAVAWIFGFLLMWLVIGNLGVLPYQILPYAIPLSLLEVWVASLLIVKISRT